jgi:hypothetical protein
MSSISANLRSPTTAALLSDHASWERPAWRRQRPVTSEFGLEANVNEALVVPLTSL